MNLGLTLSGGGFRATLFHLGVIKALRDADFLRQVKVISCVSGGSILGAHLLANWNKYVNSSEEEFNQLIRPLIEFTQKGVRQRIQRRRLPQYLCPPLFNWRKRTIDLLLEEYQHLFGNTTVADCYKGANPPHVLINCSNLNKGELVSFSKEGLLYRRSGKTWLLRTALTRLATAVTASSAFPGFFTPMVVTENTIEADRDDWTKHAFSREAFTDGGVYDNLGIRGLLEARQVWEINGHHGRDIFSVSDLDYIIVSNAGSPFEWASRRQVSGSLLRTALRATDIMMARILELELADLDRIQSASPAKLPATPIHIRIMDHVRDPDRCGGDIVNIQDALKNLRTDLDSFSALEVDSLVRHGYCIARQCLLDQANFKFDNLENSQFGHPFAWTCDPHGKSSKSKSDTRLEALRRGAYRRLSLWDYLCWKDRFGVFYSIATGVALIAALVASYIVLTERRAFSKVISARWTVELRYADFLQGWLANLSEWERSTFKELKNEQSLRRNRAELKRLLSERSYTNVTDGMIMTFLERLERQESVTNRVGRGIYYTSDIRTYQKDLPRWHGFGLYKYREDETERQHAVTGYYETTSAQTIRLQVSQYESTPVGEPRRPGVTWACTLTKSSSEEVYSGEVQLTTGEDRKDLATPYVLGTLHMRKDSLISRIKRLF